MRISATLIFVEGHFSMMIKVFIYLEGKPYIYNFRVERKKAGSKIYSTTRHVPGTKRQAASAAICCFLTFLFERSKQPAV